MIDNYNKLSVGKYEEICDIDERETEPIDRQVAILSVLSGMSEDDILNLPIAEYQKMVRKSAFLNKDAPLPTMRVFKAYKLGEFDLRPVKEVGQMTAAQYIDFQTFTKDKTGRLVEMASCFLVPKGFKYNYGYDILEVQKAIREHMSIVDLDNLLAFFLQKLIDSMRGSLTYSGWIVKRMTDSQKKKELMTKIQETKTALRSATDGLRILMQSPKPADAVGTRYGARQ